MSAIRIAATLLLAACALTGPARAERFFVLLESGANRAPFEAGEQERQQQAHVDNLGRLYREGKSPFAGPIDGGGNLRGIVVVDAADEAALAGEFASDPFVRDDRLRLRAGRLSFTTGAPGRAREPFELGTYAIALIHPDGAPDEPAALRTFTEFEGRVKAADAERLLALAGPVAGDEDLIGVMLFRTGDKAAVEELLDGAAGADAEFSVEVYGQFLGQGVLEELQAGIATASHFRVDCRVADDALAREALEIAEATWPILADLLGAGDAAPKEPRTLHLYAAVADYERAEAALTKGKYQKNLAFSSHETLETHVVIQPQTDPAVLAAVGLPALTENLIAHEAAHLAVYVMAPNFKSHPDWLAEGLAEYAAVRALQQVGRLGDPLQDPYFGTKFLRAADALRAKDAPKLSKVLGGDLPQIDVMPRYGMAWRMLEVMLGGKREQAGRKLLQRLGSLPAGKGFGPRILAVAKDVYGASGLAGLDREFEQDLAAARERGVAWNELLRSLETHGDEWEQIAFPDRKNENDKAMAWATAALPKTGFEVAGEVRILASGNRQANLLLRMAGDNFLMFAITAGGRITTFQCDVPTSKWTELGSVAAPDVPLDRAFPFVLRYDGANARLNLLGSDRSEVKCQTPLDGGWGLSVQDGCAAIWSKVRAK